MPLSQISILSDSRLNLDVSRGEDPSCRMLLMSFPLVDGTVHHAEVQLTPADLAALAAQASRQVVDHRTVDERLWVTGDRHTWTLRFAVNQESADDVALDARQTAALQTALFEEGLGRWVPRD
jgi:hypothetical protein